MTFFPVSTLIPSARSCPPPPLDSSSDAVFGATFFKRDTMTVLYNYLSVWVQKQCVCLFRDANTVDNFCFLIQQLTRKDGSPNLVVHTHSLFNLAI